jgi:ABC-type branched-subunit amino acid transport system ATPase component
MLQVRDIHKNFGGIKALNNFSFQVEQGSIVGLIGPNGSGKSTLFNIISGFLKADSGRVLFKDQDITGRPSYKIAQSGLVRSFQISKAPQRMTVLENMLLACGQQIGENVLQGLFKIKGIREQEQRNLQRAFFYLEFVGIKHLADEYAANLSGGQRKLLSLARILIREPEMVLLDEPTAGVNPTLTNKFMSFLKGLRDEQGKTFLIVEHDMNFISKVCDRVFVLDAGELLAQGLPEQIQRDEKVLTAYLGRRARQGRNGK